MSSLRVLLLCLPPGRQNIFSAIFIQNSVQSFSTEYVSENTIIFEEKVFILKVMGRLPIFFFDRFEFTGDVVFWTKRQKMLAGTLRKWEHIYEKNHPNY